MVEGGGEEKGEGEVGEVLVEVDGVAALVPEGEEEGEPVGETEAAQGGEGDDEGEETKGEAAEEEEREVGRKFALLHGGDAAVHLKINEEGCEKQEAEKEGEEAEGAAREPFIENVARHEEDVVAGQRSQKADGLAEGEVEEENTEKDTFTPPFSVLFA